MTQYERNLKQLLELLGGREHVSIENGGYMPLVVQKLWDNQISLLHRGEQNGDYMRDPEVVFLVENGDAKPVYFRNDYVHAEHCTVEGLFGDVPVKPRLQKGLDSFCRMWLRNIRDQGFFEKAKELARQETAKEPSTNTASESGNVRPQDMKLSKTNPTSTNHRAAEKPETSDLHPLSGKERNQPMAENQSERNGPLYDLRSGRVQGGIWDREGPNGDTRYTVSLSRSYKDKEGNWQRVSSFDPADLPHVKEVLVKAEQILKEELGQDIATEVKVSRKEDVKQGQKQSI